MSVTSYSSSELAFSCVTSLVISNISNLISIKFDGSNYLQKKSLFEPIIWGHKLMPFIDGSLLPPFPIYLTYTLWYERDQMLLFWINTRFQNVNSFLYSWSHLSQANLRYSLSSLCISCSFLYHDYEMAASSY